MAWNHWNIFIGMRFFFVLFLLCTQVIEANLVERASEASAFYHVGEFEKAQAEYEQMLQEELQSWERAIVLYNLANVLLKEKKFEEARKLFQEVPLSSAVGPVLDYRKTYNTVLAMLLEGVEKTKEDYYDEAKALIYQAIVGLGEVEEAHCDLEKVKGEDACQEADEIKNLESAIYYQLSLLLLQENEHKINSLELHDGVEYLLSAVQRAFNQISFLEDTALKGDSRKRYIEYFVSQQKSWQRIWDKVEERIIDKPSEKKVKLFNEAKEAYFKGNEELSKEDIKGSREQFVKAESALKELLELIPPKKSKTEKPKEKQQQKPQQAPQTQQQQQSSEKAKSEQSKEKNVDQVLKQLLEMAQDDMAPKIEKSPKKKELRPW